jgi:hypothetical protein
MKRIRFEGPRLLCIGMMIIGVGCGVLCLIILFTLLYLTPFCLTLLFTFHRFTLLWFTPFIRFTLLCFTLWLRILLIRVKAFRLLEGIDVGGSVLRVTLLRFTLVFFTFRLRILLVRVNPLRLLSPAAGTIVTLRVDWWT